MYFTEVNSGNQIVALKFCEIEKLRLQSCHVHIQSCLEKVQSDAKVRLFINFKNKNVQSSSYKTL